MPQSKVADEKIRKSVNIYVMVILISNGYNPGFTIKELFNNNIAYNTKL